ncbi:hypothetical protein ETB97_011923 [Aspergillus alliaceus]|uniref:Glutamate carboxypeptidase n=1 Tax=Petromyces alliaceus TaxID=209559 RepID=A0A8H6E8A3_PETAA|nr:hypothetical protein ETB97_011923 [Aspergillus burnettii]
MPWTSLVISCLAVSGAYGRILGTEDTPNCKSRQGLAPATLKHLLQTVPDADEIRKSARRYTSGSHIAGQGLGRAQWTQKLWDEIGIPNTSLKSYDGILTLPNEHRVALLDTERSGDQVVYEAPLIEDNPPKAADGEQSFMSAFFACAGKGNVTARYVFANYGTRNDYGDLLQANVDIAGKIAIVKSTYESEILKKHRLVYHRSNQFTVAKEMGLAGLLIYTDPQMDGEIIVENGYQAYPDGPARPPSLIERGWVGTCSGDSIPAIPISYADAVPMLRALNGHGPLASEFNDRWQGGGLTSHNVKYNVGPSPENVVLNVYNSPYEWVGPVHDVIGTIPGCVFPEEVIILGSHHDSWGPGAGDGNSGSAALNEVARSLAAALKEGWRPLRTIILASWDSEETRHQGARGWIQENESWLNSSLAAYLNVVVAGAGTKFHAHGSPLLAQAMRNITSQVHVPGNDGNSMRTVLDAWGGKYGLGSGGDALSFLQYMYSVVDFGFTRGPKDPVFPYHSLFDTVIWMEKYGDPGWEHHLATSRVWSQLASSLADELILPFRAQDYVPVFRDGLEAISLTENLSSHLDLTPLEVAINEFAEASEAFDARSDTLADRARQQPFDNGFHPEIQDVNHRYINFERFLADPDLPSSSPYHHLIIQPAPYYFESAPFPGLSQAVTAGNWTQAATYRDTIVNQLNRLTTFLQ